MVASQLTDKSYKVPRGAIRNRLSEMGLVGRLTLCKSMSEGDISSEVAMLFENLFESDDSDGISFKFHFLITPAGTKILSQPNVNATFKWDGAAVLSLSRSVLYIAAYSKLKTSLPLAMESLDCKAQKPPKDVITIALDSEVKQNLGDGVDETKPSTLYK